MDRAEARRVMYDVEKTFEWEKWAKEIPFINWPSNWSIKAIPPFCGAVIRYRIVDNENPENSVSVYLDCYDALGCVGSPYWEVYPGTKESEQ